MKSRIFGSHPATYYLALKMAEHGHELELVSLPRPISLRPLRVPADLAEELSKLLVKRGQKAAFLDRAAASVGNGDRLVESSQLAEALRNAAEGTVARVLRPSQDNGPLSMPEGTRLIADCDLESLNEGFYWKGAERGPDRSYALEVSELYLPEGRDIGEEIDAGEVLHLEGALAFLEAHPRGGYVLSFYSFSRYAVERALRAVQSPKETGPAFWRALVLLNQGTRSLHYTQRPGLSPLRIPGCFQLSSLVGTHSPLGNIHAIECFYQAQRLLRFFEAQRQDPEAVGPVAAADEWLRRERVTFARSSFKLKLWERLLFNEKPSLLLYSLHRSLPRVLQRSLKAPLTLT